MTIPNRLVTVRPSTPDRPSEPVEGDRAGSSGHHRVPSWNAVAFAAGAVLFPMAQIPDIEALAVASDVLLLVGLVPLGVQLLRGAGVRTAVATGDPAVMSGLGSATA